MEILPDPPTFIKKTKMAAKVQKNKNTTFYRIFIYGELPIFRVPPWDHFYINQGIENRLGVGGLGATLLKSPAPRCGNSGIGMAPN